MALPKASIGNSASFQIAGTPYVYSTEYTGTKTVDFKYVTRAITVQSSGSGTGNKISFDGGTNEMTLVQNKVYRLDIKTTQMKITRATGTISIVAELTSVEAWQAATIVQGDYVTLYGCMDSEASNYDASATVSDGSCAYGLPADALFHFNGNFTETCSSSEISATGTFVSDSSGKFTTAAKFGTSGSDFHINTNVPAGTTNNSLYWDGEFVFDMWVKVDDVTNNGTIIKPDSTYAGEGMFGLEWLGSGSWKLLLGASTELIIADSISNGTWYHVAVVRDGDDDIRFYRDGGGKDMLESSGTVGNINLHFDNSLDDIGPNNLTITHPGASNGAPAYSTTTALSTSTHALHLDTTGGGDFVVIPTHYDLQFDGDFTVDFWLKWGDSALVDSTEYHCPISNKQMGTLNSNLGLGLIWFGTNYTTVARRRCFTLTMAGSGSAANYCYGDFEYFGSGSNPAHVSDTDLVSEFQHIAICRTDGLVEMWMNGIKLSVRYVANSDGSTTQLITTDTINGDNKDYYIGREVLWNNVSDSTASHAYDWNGYIDELRFVKGNALFSGSSFDASEVSHISGLSHATADGYEHATTINPNTDAAEVLFHFDGNTDDSSGNGNDGTNTGVSFVTSGVTGFTGGQAGVFDGSAQTDGGDDYVVFDDPGIGTGDFTLEFFWRRDLSTSSANAYRDSPFFINTGSAMAANGFGMYVYDTTTCYVISWNSSGAGSTRYMHVTLPSQVADTWYHVRLVRSGTTLYFYWDGTKIQTWTGVPDNIGSSSLTWNLGRVLNGAGSDLRYYNFKGQMEEFQIFKTALSTGGSFTVPSVPHDPGYEVGGASDTSFEGSVDELRIVKGDSEVPTVQTDEYDC